MGRRTALVVGGATVVASSSAGSSAASSPSLPPPDRRLAAPAALAARARRGGGCGLAGHRRRARAAGRRSPAGRRSSSPNSSAYQLRWRETGDAASSHVRTPRSDGRCTSAQRTSSVSACSRSSGTTSGCARAWPKGTAPASRSARPYGLIGDALVELGRYDAAFAAFERMVSLRPGLASYARIAYARSSSATARGGRGAMRLALDAAEDSRADCLGTRRAREARARLGRRLAAGRHASALRVVPGYPAARVELARIEAARGRRNGRSPRRGARSPFRPLRRSGSSRSFSTARVVTGRRSASAPPSRSSAGCSRRTASASTSSPPSTAPITAPACARTSSPHAVRGRRGPRSTGTMPLAGPLPARPLRRCRLRAALPSPGHEGPPSLLPLRATPRGARETGPRCATGTGGRSPSTRSSRPLGAGRRRARGR